MLQRSRSSKKADVIRTDEDVMMPPPSQLSITPQKYQIENNLKKAIGQGKGRLQHHRAASEVKELQVQALLQLPSPGQEPSKAPSDKLVGLATTLGSPTPGPEAV